MEIVLPLLMRVLSRETDALLASDVRVTVESLLAVLEFEFLKDIQVPHTDDEVTELTIAFNLGVHDGVVLDEVIHCDDLILAVDRVGAVQRSEKVVEIETGLVHSFDSCEHVGVSLRSKLSLDLVELKDTALVTVKVLESLLNEFEPLAGHLLHQVI